MLKDAAIQKAIRDGKTKTLSDGSGKGTGRLVVIVRTTKNRTTAEFYAQQWSEGSRRLIKIGNYPAVSLADARRIFDDKFAPLISKQINIKKSETNQKGTVSDLFAAYVNDLRIRNCGCADSHEKQLNRIVNDLGSEKPANELTTLDIINVLRPVYESGSKGMANAFRAYISAAYSYGMRSENDYKNPVKKRRFEIKINPASAIPSDYGPPGERWLSVDELCAFWKHLEANPCNVSSVLKMIILTGQRVTEINRIDSSVFDLKERTLFWQKTKNGCSHFLPITERASELLNEIGSNEHGLYFPRVNDPSRHVTKYLIYDHVKKYCTRNNVEKFSPRDLRRTWKTLAGSAGISKDDRDRLQNHKRSDVSSKHYDRYEYLNEKRAAVEIWARWFEENVIRKL